MTWNHHRVVAVVDAPIEQAFEIYHDVTDHPKWSPWLVNVEWVNFEEQLSSWTLRKFGITLSWNAVNDVVEPPHRIRWKALDGNVKHAGSVEFTPKSSGTTQMELTVSYDAPKFLAAMFRSAWLDKFVQKTIMGDLQRFNRVLHSRAKTLTHQLSESDDSDEVGCR